jgi:hypothetical protein
MGQTMGRNLWGRQLPHLASVLAGFIVFAVASMFPGLGWIFSGVLSVLALGLAVTTRFGSEPAVVGAIPGSPVPPPIWAATPASGAPTMGPDPGSNPA